VSARSSENWRMCNIKVAELAERVDRVSDRLERVEKRLDLTDA